MGTKDLGELFIVSDKGIDLDQILNLQPQVMENPGSSHVLPRVQLAQIFGMFCVILTTTAPTQSPSHTTIVFVLLDRHRDLLGTKLGSRASGSTVAEITEITRLGADQRHG